MTPSAGIFGGLAVSFVIFTIIGVIGLAFWLWMLVDAMTKQPEDKLVWVLVLIFGSIIGAFVYYLMPRKKRLEMEMKQAA